MTFIKYTDISRDLKTIAFHSNIKKNINLRIFRYLR